jgi:DEAD/DEAH box helicase domain-containing protein
MNIVVFDLETQNLFEDVGGRNNIGALKVSCAVTWSSLRNGFTTYWEKDVPALIAELKSAGRVIGFNLKGFDYEVLRPYAPNERLQFLPTLDIMEELFRALSFRPRLDAVARATESNPGRKLSVWNRSSMISSVGRNCSRSLGA